MPCAQQLTAASELQVLLGDDEAVLGLPHDVEPRPGSFAKRRAVDEDAGGLARPPADATAELVELRQPEALGMLDDHDACIWHIDADLDHGGGDEHLELA